MELVDRTLDFISSQFQVVNSPCLLSSFGKDSMVMLWLVRRLKPEIDVVYFDAFPSPTKHRFALDIAQKWKLNLHSPMARTRDVVAKDDHVELGELFELAPERLTYFPIEAEPYYTPAADCLCALDKIFAPVAAKCDFGFDSAFTGIRGDDVDPIWGKGVPPASVIDQDGFKLIYPLRDWTERDIWDASFAYGIPQNEARYFNNDMTANNDYYPLCTKCLASDGEVICPQTNLPLMGRRSDLKLDERREEWRKAFVNLERV